MHLAGDLIAHVRGLAAVGPRDRRDVLGPLLARPEHRPPDQAVPAVDHRKLPAVLLERPDIVGLAKFFLITPIELPPYAPLSETPDCRPVGGGAPSPSEGPAVAVTPTRYAA